MGKNHNYEVFAQQGTQRQYRIKNGRLILAEETGLSGESVRVFDSAYKKMFSTTRSRINADAAAKKLGQYERDICLFSRTEKEGRVRAAAPDAQMSEALKELSDAAAPMQCSIVSAESQKEIYDAERGERKFCGVEKYAFWSVENERDSVLNRQLFGIFSFDRLEEYRQKIRQEKERLLLPLQEEEAGGSVSVLFAQETAGYLFHELIGHCFEAAKTVQCDYFQDAYKKRLTDYPLNAWDDNFARGAPVACDDEGTKKVCTQLLSQGRSAALLTDKSHRPAAFGLSGNCRRNSIYFYPETRMYRIRVEAGKKSMEELLPSVRHALVVTHVHRGGFEHRSGIVSLYAYADAEIIDGAPYPRRMYLMIRDRLENFFRGICAMTNESKWSGIYCVSSSGPLYTEAEAPAVLINNIHIERKWLI